MAKQTYLLAAKKKQMEQNILLFLYENNSRGRSIAEISDGLVVKKQFVIGDTELFNTVIKSLEKAGLAYVKSERYYLTKASTHLLQEYHEECCSEVEREDAVKQAREFFAAFKKDIEQYPAKKTLKDKFVAYVGHPDRETPAEFSNKLVLLECTTWPAGVFDLIGATAEERVVPQQ